MRTSETSCASALRAPAPILLDRPYRPFVVSAGRTGGAGSDQPRGPASPAPSGTSEAATFINELTTRTT